MRPSIEANDVFMARCAEAHAAFEQGHMSEDLYRATLFRLGFRGQEITAEVHLHWPATRGGEKMTDLQHTIRAIRAREQGVWDDSALVAFGPLTADTAADVQAIKTECLRKLYGRRSARGKRIAYA